MRSPSIRSCATSRIVLVLAWGDGFWTLIPFTLQMSVMLIAGYVLASSPPVFRAIGWIAERPRTAKGAVLLTAVFSMFTGLAQLGIQPDWHGRARAARSGRRAAGGRLSCARGLQRARDLHRVGARVSAALRRCRWRARRRCQSGLYRIAGEIPLTETIFRWESLVAVVVEIVVVGAVMWLYAPGDGRGRSAAALGVDLGPAEPPPVAPPTQPGEWLEHSPVLILPVVALGFAYLALTSTREPRRWPRR